MNEKKQSRSTKIVVSIIVLLFVAFFALRPLLCKALVADIHTLKWEFSGWGVILKECMFRFDDGLVEVTYFDYDETLVSHTEYTFSEDQQKELREACYASRLPLWRGSYYDPNPGYTDGEVWIITIGYDNRERVISGSSAYPRLYHTLYDTAKAITDAMEAE